MFPLSRDLKLRYFVKNYAEKIKFYLGELNEYSSQVDIAEVESLKMKYLQVLLNYS